MLRINSILGLAGDDDLTDTLHTLAHDGKVEYIYLSADDMRRRRLLVKTDQGEECAIALSRAQSLANGAVLWLEKARAIVVKAKTAKWLVFEPQTVDAALELGYLAGNMHWQARMGEGLLRIEMDSAEPTYLNRLAPLLDAGKVKQVKE